MHDGSWDANDGQDKASLDQCWETETGERGMECMATGS